MCFTSSHLSLFGSDVRCDACSVFIFCNRITCYLLRKTMLFPVVLHLFTITDTKMSVKQGIIFDLFHTVLWFHHKFCLDYWL